MKTDTPGNKESCDGITNRYVLVKFGLFLFLGLLTVYAKFLWPLVFGRMHNEGIALYTAIRDISVHAVAFIMLASSCIVVALWVYMWGRKGG